MLFYIAGKIVILILKKSAMEIIAYFNILILIFIGLLHFYWSFGGRIGFMDSLPEEHGKKLFIPDNKQTAFVASLFTLLSIIHLCYTELLTFPFHENIGKYGVLILTLIFGIRAFGDFKYLGFTKKIKEGQFSKNDTLIYAPMCLLISITNGLLFYFSK